MKTIYGYDLSDDLLKYKSGLIKFDELIKKLTEEFNIEDMYVCVLRFLNEALNDFTEKLDDIDVEDENWEDEYDKTIDDCAILIVKLIGRYNTIYMLTEEQEEEFIKHFINFAPSPYEGQDIVTSCPWCCPWIYAQTRIRGSFNADTVEELAKLYADYYGEDAANSISDE